ncbi:aminopeptidase P family protein [Candidatus Micrarchaeota archaeon]|jgi:Xaa-Pro dipeptidase|nr:aminopeptidase P family protein [Candidatus Micrarchaeota archaeon]
MIVIPSESVHFKYFTGFEAAGCYLIKNDMEEDGELFCSEMEYQRMKNNWEDVKLGKIADVLKLGKSFDIPFDISHSLMIKFKGKKIKDCSKEIEEMRMIKFPEEKSAIKEAEKICLELVPELPKIVKKYTEEEASHWIKRELHDMEADPSFEPIVAYDENSAFPHHQSEDKKCKNIALIDFGAKVEGYCSDVTFTIGFNPHMNKISDGIEDAWNDIKKSIKPNVKINRLATLAEGIIKNHVDTHEKMIHSLGHSIGMDVHEYPRINKKSKINFEKGMVLAIEPATYTKTYGARFEKEIYL